MNESDIVKAEITEPMGQELRFVATHPSEMEAAQRQLVAWAARRLSEELQQSREITQNYNLAVKNKWRTVTLRKAMELGKTRVTAFKKIKLAVEQGFVIIPDFPLTLIAVRTSKQGPRWNRLSRDGYDAPVQPQVQPELLESGDGRYVSALCTSIPNEPGAWSPTKTI